MSGRHAVLASLVVLSVLTYLDRVCIAIAGPRMQEELGITPERWGWVLGIFAVSYGLFEIPSGALGDRLGHRRVLTRIVAWWSVFTVLTGAVSSYGMLLAIRFLFGAGEAGAFPNIAGSLGRWMPPTKRARAQGFIWAASRIGGAISPWLVVPIMAAGGWRAPFWVFGACGFAWAAAWYVWYRDPPRGGPAGALAEGPAHAGAPWGAFLRAPQFWLLLAVYWFYVWGSMFYLTWLPTYLVKGRGLTEAEMATVTALPFLLGAAGNLAGGILSDRLARDLGPRRGRGLVGSACLAVSAALILATALTPGKTAAVVLLSLGLGVIDCMLPSAWAICLDLGGNHAGALAGAMNSAGQLGGFLCTVLFGYLTRANGSYDAPLLAIAGMVAVSAVLFLGLDPTRPLDPAEATPAAAEPTCA